MYFSISPTAITSISAGYQQKEFSGSSCYKFENQTLTRKTIKQTAANTRLSARGENIQCKGATDTTLINLFTSIKEVAPMPIASVVSSNLQKEKTKIYSLNKSKLKKKIAVFFDIKASQNFCAFYSISFPLALSDKMAYKVFNTWLTRCRQNQNLVSYLWIAERQENGTIHFHMITNTFMKIKEVNNYMKSALITQHKKNNICTPIETLNNYNGVDVDNLYKSKRADQKNRGLNRKESRLKLQRYLTKYVTKNNVQFHRLPWHCSRDISALFTSQMFAEDEDNFLTLDVRENPQNYLVIEKEEIIIYIPKIHVDLAAYTKLQLVNNQVHENFFKNKLT